MKKSPIDCKLHTVVVAVKTKFCYVLSIFSKNVSQMFDEDIHV